MQTSPTRARIASGIVLALLALGSFPGRAEPPPPPGVLPGVLSGRDPADLPPNIVIINADDLGYGDLGCYGARGIRTPRLDRLAGEGTRFTAFYSAQPVCSASRAALLTGCYPNRIGIAGALPPRSKVGIHEDEVTLGELLKARGYATAIFGKWHLGDAPRFLPARHGFDEYLGLPYSNDMWPHHPSAKSGTYPPLPLIDGTEVAEVMPDQAGLTRRYTERALRFIERSRDRPFLLYLAHSMPHVPLHAGERFAGKSERGLYGDVIEEIDDSVGQVLDALDRLGLSERTWVLFTSDNGPWHSYGEHAGTAGPFREGKASVFEGGIRVPCLMRWPGRIPAGRVCDEPLMTIDIFPTIAGRVRAPLPSLPIDGRDAWPVIAGEPGARSPHRAYAFYFGQNELQALRAGKWKLLLPHTARGLQGRPGGAGGKPVPYDQIAVGLELHDLEADPGETRDIALGNPEVVRRLLGLAEEIRAELGDSLTGRKGRGTRDPGRLEEEKPPPPSGQPNIVLVVADDLGTTLGSYGDPNARTPHLDRLAAEAVRFTHAFCTTASCSPSRSVILTGLQAHANGQYGLQHAAHHFESFAGVRSLPAILGAAGYRTARIGKLHVGPESVYRFERGLSGNQGDGRNGVTMAEHARAFIAEPDARPFFLYFCPTDPHRSGPGAAAAPGGPDRFGNDGTYRGVRKETFDPEKIVVPPYLADTPACRAELAEYYRSVARLDQGVGRLLRVLEETGRRDDTVMVFLSDNGPPFPGAKTTVYDAGARLPLLVRAPGLRRPGAESTALVSWTDITPTLLDLAGVKEPGARLHGQSFRAALEGSEPAPGRHEVFGSHGLHEVTMYYPMRWIRTREHKLILNLAHPLPFPIAQDLHDSATWQEIVQKGGQCGRRRLEDFLHRPQRELYHLASDPDETRNLAADPAHAELLEELDRKLRKFQEETGDPWIVKRRHE